MTRKVHQRINHYHNPYSTENTMRRREHLPKYEAEDRRNMTSRIKSRQINRQVRSIKIGKALWDGREREREKKRILIRRCRESVKYPLTRQ